MTQYWSGTMQTVTLRAQGPQSRKDAIGDSGFTLVEILVVVIILGIAGAIIVPSIGSRNDLKAAAAAREIIADLIYTQNLAVTSQGNRYVKFGVGNQQYSVTDSAGRIITQRVDQRR